MAYPRMKDLEERVRLKLLERDLHPPPRLKERLKELKGLLEERLRGLPPGASAEDTLETACNFAVSCLVEDMAKKGALAGQPFVEVPEDDIDDIGEILEAAKDLFPGIDAEPEVKWAVHKLAFEVLSQAQQLHLTSPEHDKDREWPKLWEVEEVIWLWAPKRRQREDSARFKNWQSDAEHGATLWLAFSAAEKREFLGIWRAERETKDRSEEDHNLGVTLTHEDISKKYVKPARCIGVQNPRAQEALARLSAAHSAKSSHPTTADRGRPNMGVPSASAGCGDRDGCHGPSCEPDVAAEGASTLEADGGRLRVCPDTVPTSVRSSAACSLWAASSENERQARAPEPKRRRLVGDDTRSTFTTANSEEVRSQSPQLQTRPEGRSNLSDSPAYLVLDRTRFAESLLHSWNASSRRHNVSQGTTRRDGSGQDNGHHIQEVQGRRDELRDGAGSSRGRTSSNQPFTAGGGPSRTDVVTVPQSRGGDEDRGATSGVPRRPSGRAHAAAGPPQPVSSRAHSVPVVKTEQLN